MDSHPLFKPFFCFHSCCPDWPQASFPLYHPKLLSPHVSSAHCGFGSLRRAYLHGDELQHPPLPAPITVLIADIAFIWLFCILFLSSIVLPTRPTHLT